MSYSKNRHQAQRWLQTAEEDVHAAQVLLAGGMYAQACFYAQQSAEKAIKALWYLLDADPWGHSVQRLIAEFPQRAEIPDLEAWLDQGALLDQFYIPTRYPNGLPDLTLVRSTGWMTPGVDWKLLARSSQRAEDGWKNI